LKNNYTEIARNLVRADHAQIQNIQNLHLRIKFYQNFS